MICKGGVFLIRRHNELRDHEADLLSMVCNDIEDEPVLQDITEEQLIRGSNRRKIAPGPGTTADLSHPWKWREAVVLEEGVGCLAWLVNAAFIYNHWRDGEGMHKKP